MVPSLCRITSNVNGPAETEDETVNRFNRTQKITSSIGNVLEI